MRGKLLVLDRIGGRIGDGLGRLRRFLFHRGFLRDVFHRGFLRTC
ncbi:hypothetical protein AIOL_004816 [Candidatus Rhodobacter oscarellae]|uniref:Uncharacterized protein n=1 Tax=Candidatus Rhodobacter oscarellae TaxID=1675527 RepID=A0A0J9EAL6_9RHOB|nr:hypothetical protein AIOL_004816 [Candidatus Rhodobacter lobularis]